MSDLGFGRCPLGLGSVFGYGTPETEAPIAGNVLEKSLGGPSGDARYIDPVLRDYVIDANGNTTGTSSVFQQVFLALTTNKGSAINFNFGNQLSSIKTINSSTIQAVVTNYVNQALAFLTKPGTITIVSLNVAQDSSVRSRVNASLTFVDNTNHTTYSTNFTLGS
jgi:hypothetical protein